MPPAPRPRYAVTRLTIRLDEPRELPAGERIIAVLGSEQPGPDREWKITALVEFPPRKPGEVSYEPSWPL
jgi:hypothetical protein